MEYSIFISYRRSYAHFAGRIFDYLQNKGLDPYMDVYRVNQGYYERELQQMILDCPYFLLVLSNHCFDQPESAGVFLGEIETAIREKAPEDILIVCEPGFEYPDMSQMPETLQNLPKLQRYEISHEKFHTDMDNIVRKINMARLSDAINWREHIHGNRQTLIASRAVIENDYATMTSRFGKDLINAVQKGLHYEGEQRIKQIHMSCYAASIIFNPARDMVDDRAYDNGLLFNVFAELLRDPEFSMEILINAPGSNGAEEAIRNDMLGNSALEEYPEAVFYSAYAGLERLIREDPAFQNAYKEKRFRFYLTDIVMNGAIFQMEYKPEWSEFDHIKYDFYSYNLKSTMNRRCMLIFRESDPDNYVFLANIYSYLKDHRYKKKQIEEQREEWIARWQMIREELE